MRRSLLLGMLFLAIACAHSPQGASVQVIVNASDGALGRVDTAALQRMTEGEIQRGSALIRPLTLMVSFDSAGFVERPVGPSSPSLYRPNLVSAQSVSSLSATPWDDGLIVQHGDHVDVGSRSNHHWRREVVVGTYTISDDAGKIIERRPVVVGVLDPEVEMMTLQLASMKTTGHYLASRVAAAK